MYAQRDSSGTLLTQAFHPPSSEEHFSSQNFFEQQQQQYNQEQLEEIQEQLNQSNIQRFQITENNNFAFQTFDNNAILGNSLSTDWPQIYGSDDMCGLVDGSNFSNGVFVDGLIPQNLVGDGSSWVLNQNTGFAKDTHSSLSNSPSEADSEQNNESIISSNSNDHIRAQTPGPFQKNNIPNYLTARRRSLSADNIHALAKAQQQLANRKVYLAQQNSDQISFSRPHTIGFDQHSQFSLQNTKQQPIQMQETTINQNILQIDNQNTNQISDNDVDRNNCQQNNSVTASPTQQTTNRPQLSRSVSHQQIGPINHAQRLTEFQARFKVKLDKRNQRSMPNIHAAAHAIAQSSINLQKSNPSIGGPVNGSVPIMEINQPLSTQAFATEKSNSLKPSPNPPRRGHMRKRSLSAPTTPFPNLTQQSPGSIPLQPAQSFPLNFHMSYKPNALPIQIHRNPKHSHASAPLSSEEYQRKLNEELEKVDFDDITVSELKEMLRQRGKPATGKKAVLMQRLQEEVEHVKAMKNNSQQLKNQMMSSPTSPSSGVSLQRSIANLQISSPPIHSRRFSPYGSVSIPGSPRIMPSGLGNGRSGFSGNPYAESDEWQFHNVGMVSPLASQDLDDAVQSQAMIIMGSQQQQELYGQQQPSSAPATTTEFEQAFQQQPSSAPPMTTEFETFEFMNPMAMNMMSIPPDMMRMSINDNDLKPNPSESKPVNDDQQSSGSLVSSTSNDAVAGMLTQHQTLEFDFNAQHLQDGNVLIKSEDFLNYPMTSISHQSSQHLPMQIELPQDGMNFGGW
ncbi:24612_t:CDS:2 [Gigaspora rosea]|nr:24612_t:CDS:2 [Gigaspora rosea]